MRIALAAEGTRGDVHPLLETRFTGTFKGGYIDNEWPDDDPRLVAYLARGSDGRGDLAASRHPAFLPGTPGAGRAGDPDQSPHARRAFDDDFAAEHGQA